MDESKLEKMYDTVIAVHAALYGVNGTQGDIPEMKEDIKAALAKCESNTLEIASFKSKIKGWIAGAAAAGAGGIATGLGAIFK